MWDRKLALLFPLQGRGRGALPILFALQLGRQQPNAAVNYLLEGG